MLVRFLALAALVLTAVPAASAQHTLDLSTHVLDLARGTGGAGVPVTLDVRSGGVWRLVGRAVTAENGRVPSFPLADPSAEAPGAGLYRLTFDMAGFWDGLGSGLGGCLLSRDHRRLARRGPERAHVRAGRREPLRLQHLPRHLTPWLDPSRRPCSRSRHRARSRRRACRARCSSTLGAAALLAGGASAQISTNRLD